MMYNETEPVIEEILNQIAQTASNINLSSNVTSLIQKLISDTSCTNYHLQILPMYNSNGSISAS